jgi:ribosomal protein S18 acetylase RimI-like enzyme
VDIRTFRPEDAGGMVRLWNDALREDKADRPWYAEEVALSDDRFARMAANPNFDPEGVFLAFDEGGLLGFGRGVIKRVPAYEGEKLEELPGYLEGLVVKPSCRGKGVGTRLLRNVEDYIEAAGKDAVAITRYRAAVAGTYVLPDTPEYDFLTARGYRPTSREMRLRLMFEEFVLKDEILKTEERLRQEGIAIRDYEDRDRESFARLMEAHFQGWWHYSYRPNLERERPLPVRVAVDRGRVVGFIGFVSVSAAGRAGFSPGVDPEYRKRGIGKALVHLWARDVKALGAKDSVISVGVGNDPARTIYLGMGYRSLGEFCPVWRKDLRPSSP